VDVGLKKLRSEIPRGRSPIREKLRRLRKVEEVEEVEKS
jgi:hypothetical protein